MTLAELLKALVECDDQMERMALVEANQELFAVKEGEGEEGQGGGEEEQGEDWKAKYDELTKKYIDTFFGSGEKQEETKEEDSQEESKPKGINELLEGIK